MKNLIDINSTLAKRIPLPASMGGGVGDNSGGAFIVPLNNGEILRVIAANGEGWDHVSVSLAHRIPTWEEMSLIKRIFFKNDETAMQLHVPIKKHINVHPYVLHLWRPHNEKIPMPPEEFV